MAKSHWNEISGYTWKQLITDEGRNTWHKLYHFVYTVTATGSAIFSSLSYWRRLATFIVTPLSFAFSFSVRTMLLIAQGYIYVGIENLLRRSAKLVADTSISFSPSAFIRRVYYLYPNVLAIETNVQAMCRNFIRGLSSFVINIIPTAKIGKTLRKLMAQVQYGFNIVSVLKRWSRGLFTTYLLNFSSTAILKGWLSVEKVVSNWFDKDKPPSDGNDV